MTLRDVIQYVLDQNESRCCDNDEDKAVLVESLLERLEPYLALQAVRLRIRTPIIPQEDKE